MIGELCNKFGAGSNNVLNIIYKDRRNYKSGLGFMGPCFPRDVNCFERTCLENAVESGYKIANLLNDLNDYTVQKYIQKIKSFNKNKVGILGVAYKPNVPYVYESQPIKIAEQLSKDGFEVYIYDSLAEENSKQILRGNVQYASNVEECLEKSDVIFIGTVNYSDIKTNKILVNPWI
jgi:UDP-glucose 6-dehydrogenase